MVHETVKVMSKRTATFSNRTEDPQVCPGRKTYVYSGGGVGKSMLHLDRKAIWKLKN